MPYLGYEAMRIERFGGLNTLLDPTNLPVEASPDCQDVEFLPGLVRTRPGLTSLFTALGGNPTVNYLKSYITPTSLLRALVLDSLGNFYKENPAGTLALIGKIESQNAYGNSVSLFGREYIAFGDGQFGAAIPRQFDDTNFDRVSQVGPGLAPVCSDSNFSANVIAAPNGAAQFASASITAISENGNVVTVTTSAAYGLNVVNESVVISGVAVGGYNGTFLVASVASATQFTYVNPTANLAASSGGTVASQTGIIKTDLATFTFGVTNPPFSAAQTVVISGVTVGGYNGTWKVLATFTYSTLPIKQGLYVITSSTGLGTSGSGTVSDAGNIVAGVHQCSVMFVDREGYITMPAVPPSKWTAAGGKRVIVNNIPIGASNIVSRILIFTATAGASFFYMPNGDVSIFGSTMTLNNTDSTAYIDFTDTLLLAGTNADEFFNLIELGACSGVTQYSSRLFWWGERNRVENLVNMSFDGGLAVVANGPPLGWTKDLTNGAGGSIETLNVIFGFAYKITGDGASATRGLISQTLVSDYLGNPILSSSVNSWTISAWVARTAGLVAGTLHINSSGVGISVTSAQASTSYQKFTATFVSGTVLQVFADGTPTNNESFLIENIEIYPTAAPVNLTTIRCSKVEDPESYDGITGILQPAPQNGQAVRACYARRQNLYMVKERSLFVTQDDGTNEPNQWTVIEISKKVGTPSVRGVGFGDEWEIIAGVDGVYYFNGGEPQKVSQEIQPTWDGINWSLGHFVDVKIDTKRKRVYIAVPLGASATANNRVLTLDYTEGWGEDQRKWSPWAIASNSMDLILRSDGTQQLWLGNGTGIAAATGKIYQLDSTGGVFSDDGAAINSYWQSGYFQDIGRLTFGPLVANLVGSGALNLILRKGNQGWLTNLRSWTLPANGFRNLERMLNIETERLAVRLGTNAAGANFSLQGLQLYAKPATWAVLRGVNT